MKSSNFILEEKKKCLAVKRNDVKFSTAYDKQASSTCDAPAMMLGLVTCVPAPSASICHSQLDRTLKCRWEEAVEAGLCRYRLERVQNRVLPGKFGFVAQVLYI